MKIIATGNIYLLTDTYGLKLSKEFRFNLTLVSKQTSKSNQLKLTSSQSLKELKEGEFSSHLKKKKRKNCKSTWKLNIYIYIKP